MPTRSQPSSSRQKKRRWRILPEGKPGERFEQRYEKGRARRGSPWSRVLTIGGAIILLAVGLFFTVVPGPGIPFLLAGAGLLATQWRGVARLLDRFEIRIRKIAKALATWWRRAGTLTRVAVISVAAVIAAGGALLAWKIFTG